VGGIPERGKKWNGTEKGATKDSGYRLNVLGGNKTTQKRERQMGAWTKGLLYQKTGPCGKYAGHPRDEGRAGIFGIR